MKIPTLNISIRISPKNSDIQGRGTYSGFCIGIILSKRLNSVMKQESSLSILVEYLIKIREICSLLLLKSHQQITHMGTQILQIGFLQVSKLCLCCACENLDFSLEFYYQPLMCAKQTAQTLYFIEK